MRTQQLSYALHSRRDRRQKRQSTDHNHVQPCQSGMQCQGQSMSMRHQTFSQDDQRHHRVRLI